jgi:hypothetical protein
MDLALSLYLFVTGLSLAGLYVLYRVVFKH